MTRTIALIATLSAFALSCGDKEEGTDSGAAGDGGDDSVSIDCSTDAWDGDADQSWQMAWMGACLMPEISPIITDADPDRTVGCGSCHGSDMNGGSYEMPNGVEIDFNNISADHAALYAVDEDWNATGAMLDVTSTAATLLGIPELDWETGEGEFGCGSCHIVAQ